MMNSVNQSAIDPPASNAKSRGLLFKGVVLMINLCIAGALVFGGVSVIERQANAQQGTQNARPVTVNAEMLNRQTSYFIKERFVGEIEAPQTTNLAFEQGGIVSKVLREEGEQVKAGDVIAEIDSRLMRAKLDELVASKQSLLVTLERTELDLQREERLEARGFSADQSYDHARLAVQQSQAAIRQMDAAIRQQVVLIDQTRLKAPFDGVIGVRSMDVGGIVAPGTPVVTLYDSSMQLARVALPMDRAAQLRQDVSYKLNSNQQQISAQFVRLRPDLDTKTRTVSALFKLGTSESDTVNVLTSLPYGETVQLHLSQERTQPGYWLPLSALQEGTNGLWSVMLVSSASQHTLKLSQQATPQVAETMDTGHFSVSRVAVEVLHTEADRAYIKASLPEDSLIVTVGGHRVVAGQRVELASAELSQ